MKILIFGSSGYLAQFVIDKLIEDGHSVSLVFRKGTSGSIENLLNRDNSNLSEIVVKNRPDVVLNMTNFFTKGSGFEEISQLSQVNCEFITELSKACSSVDAVFFQIGSAWQADFTSTDPSIGNMYALYKGLANQILLWFERSYDLKVFRLNLFDTYGPGDTRGKIVQYLVEQINMPGTLELSGGKQILELVHVSDVASAISAGIARIEQLNAQKSPFSEEPIYWCLPENPVTLREIVEEVNKNVVQPINVQWGVKPYRKGEIFKRDQYSRIVIPGWKANISLEEGIKGIIQKH